MSTEDKPVIHSPTASDADHFRVELVDGRVQEIAIGQFDGSGKDISVEISEQKNVTGIRSGKTQ